MCCLRYCKSTIFQANHNTGLGNVTYLKLFAILQKYDFSSKSQLGWCGYRDGACCLRYCKSTIFQANHNVFLCTQIDIIVVCDTAKVRFFKQITTNAHTLCIEFRLFAILQKYDFSSKSQQFQKNKATISSCLRYCKSTIFQANHNKLSKMHKKKLVVCDTAKVRFFKQITTVVQWLCSSHSLFAILQKYDFSSKSQLQSYNWGADFCCLRYCKSTIFQANHNLSQH